MIDAIARAVVVAALSVISQHYAKMWEFYHILKLNINENFVLVLKYDLKWKKEKENIQKEEENH